MPQKGEKMKKITILMVDDTSSERDLFLALFESYKYNILTANNGYQALEVLKDNHVDIIISDILMPEMDGYRLCEIVKHDSNLKKIVFIYKKLLTKLGYHVYEFTDSKQAFEAFQEKKDLVDLVISDIVMPSMPGNKLAMEMLSIKPDLPIILTTGYADLIDENEIIDTGVKKVIFKPITIEQLSMTISEILNKR